MFKEKFNTYIRLLCSIALAVLYASWLSKLPSHLFKDRENYLLYAAYPNEFIDKLEFKSFLFFEPIFLYVNRLLLFLNNPELTVHILVFFITFSIAFFCFYRTNNFLFGFFLLFFLFIQTQALGMQLVTLRQGIGMAVVLLTLPFFKKKSHLLLLLTVLGFMHNSFFIISLFYGVYWLIFSKLKSNNFVKTSWFFLFGIAFSLLFFILKQFVETKQDYEGFEFSSGGGAFLMWLIVFIYIYIFKSKISRSFYSQAVFEISVIGLIIYLCGYFLTPISGRIIGFFIPLIFLTIINNFKTRDFVFLIIVSLVNLYLYVKGAFEGFLEVPLETFHKYLLMNIL